MQVPFFLKYILEVFFEVTEKRLATFSSLHCLDPSSFLLVKDFIYLDCCSCGCKPFHCFVRPAFLHIFKQLILSIFVIIILIS